jgi:hypothetical protein
MWCYVLCSPPLVPHSGGESAHSFSAGETARLRSGLVVVSLGYGSQVLPFADDEAQGGGEGLALFLGVVADGVVVVGCEGDVASDEFGHAGPRLAR